LKFTFLGSELREPTSAIPKRPPLVLSIVPFWTITFGGM